MLKGDSYTLECGVLLMKNFDVTDSLLIRVIEHLTADVPLQFTFVYEPRTLTTPYSSFEVSKDRSYFECLVQATMSSGQSSARTIIVFSDTAVVELQCKILSFHLIHHDCYIYIGPALVLSLNSSFNSTVIPLGSTVVLTCAYEGIPAPTVVWVYNGWHHYNGTDNGGQDTFTINNFQSRHVGVYQCIVKNTYQYSSQSLSLYVKG